MKTIESQNIIGVKVWKDDENYQELSGFIMNQKEMNKRRLLEFKSMKEFKHFVSAMNKYKRMFDDVEKRSKELAERQAEAMAAMRR